MRKYFFKILMKLFSKKPIVKKWNMTIEYIGTTQLSLSITQDNFGSVWLEENWDGLLKGFQPAWWSPFSPRSTQPEHTLHYVGVGSKRANEKACSTRMMWKDLKYEETWMLLTALVHCLTSYSHQRESGHAAHCSSLSLTSKREHQSFSMLAVLP